MKAEPQTSSERLISADDLESTGGFAEPELSGWVKYNWIIDLPRTDYKDLGHAIAELENSEPLLAIHRLSIQASHEQPQFQRYTEKTLSDVAQFDIPPERPRMSREEAVKRRDFRRAFRQFVIDEKIAAIIEPASGDFGTFNVQGGGTQHANDQFHL